MPDKQKRKKRIRPVIEEVVTSNKNEEASIKEPTPEPLQQQYPEKTNLKLIFFLTVITALIVGFVSGGVYVYFSGISAVPDSEKSTSTPPPTIIPEPSATPKQTPESEEIDLSQYKISVLNGSGKIGEASNAGSLLEENGFKVEDIGNASRYDFEDTVLQTKKQIPQSVVVLLEKALSSIYVVEIDSENLPESSEFDFVITVGSKLAQ